MQLLERDPAFQAFIQGFPDNAHTASAYPAQQAISIADENLWFGHLQVLPRRRTFPRLRPERVADSDRHAGVIGDPLRWTAPVFAGKGSSMSNAIIKQLGDSPIVADNIFQFRL